MGSNQDLISLASNTKDFAGSEISLRGGFMVMTNIDPEINQLFVKIKSINLCSSTPAQFLTDLTVNPPTLKHHSKETVKEYNC